MHTQRLAGATLHPEKVVDAKSSGDAAAERQHRITLWWGLQAIALLGGSAQYPAERAAAEAAAAETLLRA